MEGRTGAAKRVAAVTKTYKQHTGTRGDGGERAGPTQIGQADRNAVLVVLM
jgi:hypothetical protein